MPCFLSHPFPKRMGVFSNFITSKVIFSSCGPMVILVVTIWLISWTCFPLARIARAGNFLWAKGSWLLCANLGSMKQPLAPQLMVTELGIRWYLGSRRHSNSMDSAWSDMHTLWTAVQGTSGSHESKEFVIFKGSVVLEGRPQTDFGPLRSPLTLGFCLFPTVRLLLVL